MNTQKRRFWPKVSLTQAVVVVRVYDRFGAVSSAFIWIDRLALETELSTHGGHEIQDLSET